MQEIVLTLPLVDHKLAILRNKETGTKEFREIVKELASFLCYEALRDAKTSEMEIDTPICKTTVKMIDENKYAFVPILRAGISMVDGVLNVMPNAKIGHIGLYRDEETLNPVEYYFRMPKDIALREVLLLDPMLATGGSAVNAITQLKKRGVTKIKFLCIIAAPEGIENVKRNHPDVQIFCTAVDEKLNEKGYIVPGLGDAGDRIFGTR
ncbi:uracil phosphoribosyltransferase [Bacteroidales bacterium OttesenSCG-928-K22]|nr:uracil phosphoribosyltransferase [Bacteroidales bacterium OttesenSCG-928-L14]MDL2240522.1 uracil phosphoribosyltransferase [Bacteroidales bacterium OttesenSCG-928-K22]